MAAITASQMRKIYVTARELGMDNDLLHIHVHTLTGKDSLKELTIYEAVEVIDSLERKNREPSRPGGMTKKQEAYMRVLAKELGWINEAGQPDEKRLNGFVSKRFGVDHYRWLSVSMASKVIEGLKNMTKNQKEEKACQKQ